MKRSLILLCAAALLATLPLASMAEAGRHGRHGRPGWPNRATMRGSCRRANPTRRPLQGWQGWRGRRGWRDCQNTQPEEVMVEICHVIEFVYPSDMPPVALCELVEVPESQVAEHLAHGDRTDMTEVFNMTVDFQLFLALLGIDTGNANLWFYAAP